MYHPKPMVKRVRRIAWRAAHFDGDECWFKTCPIGELPRLIAANDLDPFWW